MNKERSARDIIAGNTLNEYERAIFYGLKQSKGSKALKAKILSDAISGVLNGNVEIDGDEMTVAEALVVKVVGEAIANPTTSKLKDLASIIGDVGATKVEVYQSQVDEDLARAAINEVLLDGEE